MTQKQKTILLWVLIVVLLFLQLFMEERQGGEVGKLAGRILHTALFIYALRSSKKILR